MAREQKGCIVNKWVGTGTIRKMEFVKETNKYRFMLEQPAFIKDGEGSDVEHTNLFSVNLPSALNKMMEDYANGDFIYMEGYLAQSDRSQVTKIRLVYLKHFDPVYIETGKEI